MMFLKQSSLLALAACLGLGLVGCQPSDPNKPNVADVDSIAVTPNPVSLEIGGVQALTVTGSFSNDTSFVVTFDSRFAVTDSSAPNVVRVDAATGYVTALANGSATIRATHTPSGKTATTTVTVAPLRVLSIAVSPAAVTLAPGATQALTVNATYNNLTTGPVTAGSTFVSLNPAVATVDAAGVVAAVAVGTANIRAIHTASGNTAEAAITVAEIISSDFTTITFEPDGVTYALRGFAGAEDSQVVTDPTDATNTVAQVIRSATAETYAGTVVFTGPNETVGTIPFSATNTRMTVRVWSPAADIRVLLKLEDATSPGCPNSCTSVETEAVTTGVGWQTLTFDFANGTPALDLSNNYNRLIIFFNFGVAGATAGEQTFYFDDVLFVAGGGPLVFASGYASNNRTVEGGEWGFYSGNFTNYSNTYAGGEFVDDNPALPAADTYVYLVVATSAPTTDGFMGIFTAAPGYTTANPNAGVTLSGQQNLEIELGMAPEWFQQVDNKQLTVRLIGSQVYSNGSGGFCQILVEQRVTPTTADLTLYTLPLNSMTLAQACNGGGFTSGVSTLAEALAQPIGEIHVQAVFPQVNTTVRNGAGTEYPTGFTRGSVSFN